MNYKTYKDTHSDYTALQQILYNRGIEIGDQERWLTAGWEDVHGPWCLGKNLKDGVEMLYQAYTQNKNMAILCDEDPDGATSTAIAYNFLNYLDHGYAEKYIDIIFHQSRCHGLKDIDLEKLATYDIVWIPDAASNDYDELEYLIEHNTQVIITDHHLAPYTMNIQDKIYTFNNQVELQGECRYPNRDFSGAGMTWQLCRGLELLIRNCTTFCDNNLLDLCAIGLLSDMMDYHNLEIRAIVYMGLSNLKNKFLVQLAKTNQYTIDKRNGLNYLSAAFGITPFINCCFRSATYEEKLLVINAMFDINADVVVPSTKRGEKGIEVPIWQEACTVAQRVKRRQTKLQDEADAKFAARIQEEHLLDNAILLLLCEPGEVDKNLAGLLANRYQTKYQRPCAILTRCEDNGKEYYRGSMRNYSLSERTNLKADLEATGQIEWCQGHENSAGLSIPVDNIDTFLKNFNELYKDVKQEPVYWVDYIWSMEESDPQKIIDMGGFDIYGQGLPESMIAVHDIDLDKCNLQLMGLDKGRPTLKITLPNGISCIKFGSSQKEFDKFNSGNTLATIVGKPQKNEWMGNISAQIIVEDFELKDNEEWVF